MTDLLHHCVAVQQSSLDMDKARELIAEHLGVSLALIQDQVSFRELGADSLDLVSLTMAFEEAFDLPISDEQAEACETVGDALRLIDQQLSARGQGGAMLLTMEPSVGRG